MVAEISAGREPRRAPRPRVSPCHASTSSQNNRFFCALKNAPPVSGEGEPKSKNNDEPKQCLTERKTHSNAIGVDRRSSRRGLGRVRPASAARWCLCMVADGGGCAPGGDRVVTGWVTAWSRAWSARVRRAVTPLALQYLDAAQSFPQD